MAQHDLLQGLAIATLVVGTSACFNPEEPVADTEGTDGTAGTIAGDDGGTPGSTLPGDGVDDGADDGVMTTAPTDGGTMSVDDTAGATMGEESGSTGDPPAACGDGTVDPGELCLPNQPETFSAGAGAIRLAAGPLSANVGVVTVNPAAGTLSILLGDGTGGFSAPTSKSAGVAGGGPVAVRLGDLDGDGDVDIVVRAAEEMRWFLNNGAGMFPGSGGSTDTGGFGLNETLVLDNFDTDAALDGAYSDGYNICFLLGSVDNNGNYSMGTGSGCNSSIQIFEDHFAIATEFGFDGDGFRDLFVGASWGPMVAGVRGNGDGTFMTTGAAASGIDVCNGAGCEVNGLGQGDLDDDGEVEMIAAHDQGISIVPANGDGSYGMPFFLPADDAYEPWVGDIDGDGDADIVVAARLESALLVFLGDGTGTFEAPLSFAVAAEVVSVAVADVDNDGALDLLTTYDDGSGTGTVAVFRADP